MTVKELPDLIDAITTFDRGMLVSYSELLQVFDQMNRQFRSGQQPAAEDINPRDLPGGADWPDMWASRIWRDVQRNRVRKMEA